jgi:hypothetical protein
MAGCLSYPGKAYIDQKAQERQLTFAIEQVKQQTPMTVVETHEPIGAPGSPSGRLGPGSEPAQRGLSRFYWYPTRFFGTLNNKSMRSWRDDA